jgi:hypothetical protein
MPAIRLVLPLAALLAASLGAAAQPYCANYSDGEKTCGIATLEICQQSAASAAIADRTRVRRYGQI